MWEAIEANKRRSWVLVSLMGILLVGLGFFAGLFVDPRHGGAVGTLAALVVWLGLWLGALLQGDQILLATAGARKLEREDAPQIFNVVEEMKIASGLEGMPEVYLIPEDAPNAFAVGRKPDRCAVAVTSGLLRLLDRDELQGVIGHEIGHLRNRDTAFMMLVGVMLGAIVLIADLFLRSIRYVGGGRRRSSGGGQAQLLLFIVAILFAILAPLVAQMIYFACSRRREYLADASSARFTRYPEGLASALEKLKVYVTRTQAVNRVLAPMYIVSPMQALAAVGLFSTHPPTEARIRILRGMAGGAGFADYEAAFKRIVGRSCVGRRTLSADSPAALRGPSAERETSKDAVQRSREVVDLLGRLNNLILMTCPCGVGIKVPPGVARDSIPCPRCGRENTVPKAEPVEGSAEGEAPPGDFRYLRQGKGWESFKCPCGYAIQLSPMFEAPRIACNGCGRKIEVLS